MVPDVAISQAAFGGAVGISQQAVSDLVQQGVLPAGGTAREWLLAYCGRLREQAAGRLGDGGGLDVVQESAALKKAQREHYEIKNAVARGDYAPIGLLTDTLGAAAGAAADRLDALPAQLRMLFPDLPAPVRDAIASVVAGARNELIKGATELVARRLEEADDEGEALAEA